MKKNMTAFILAGVLTFSVCSCGSNGSEKNDNTANSQNEIITEENQTKVTEEMETIGENLTEIKKMITATEESAALLENSIKNDMLTQTEYNEKTQQLYELWDIALNTLWSSLKQTLDEETMTSLLAKQREWIAEKEQAVAEAGAEYEGGSMQPMVMNQKAAEITQNRVYELMELLE